MPRKPKKYPRDMTDEEAIKHLFHPKIRLAIHKHLRGQDQALQPSRAKSKKTE